MMSKQTDNFLQNFTYFYKIMFLHFKNSFMEQFIKHLFDYITIFMTSVCHI